MIDKAVIEALVDGAVRRLHLPSAAVGLWAQGSEQFYVSGHRSLPGQAANADTVYRIASCSKSYIATAIALLAEENLLSLDDPVQRHLPEFALYTEELSAAVTIRDLLCHRTGLARHDIASYANPGRSLGEMAASLRWLEPSYSLRERFHYQNHMYGVLSLLIERLSHMPWGEFVYQRLLAPAGMERSFCRCAELHRPDGNYARPKMLLGGINLPFVEGKDDSTGGAGSISASLRDLLCWVRLHLGYGRLAVQPQPAVSHQLPAAGQAPLVVQPQPPAVQAQTAGGQPQPPAAQPQPAASQQLLPRSVFTELHSPQIPIRPGEMSDIQLPFVTDTAYGLGWFVEHFRGELLIHHGGTVFGYKAAMGFMPEHDFGFAVLINQHNSPGCDAIARGLCDIVLGVAPAFDWVGSCTQLWEQSNACRRALIKQRLAPPDRPRPMVDPNKVLGRYHHPAYGDCEVRKAIGGLSLRYAGMSIALKPSLTAASGGDTGFALYSRLAATAFPCRFEYANSALENAGQAVEPDAACTDAVCKDTGQATALLAWLDESSASPIRFQRTG
jgi:CubicO group peptidase (beta-lactamase class C family)